MKGNQEKKRNGKENQRRDGRAVESKARVKSNRAEDGREEEEKEK